MWHIQTLLRSGLAALGRRLRGDRGEGVVSAAIAILIIAVVGVALFAAAQGWFSDLSGTVDEQIEQLES